MTKKNKKQAALQKQQTRTQTFPTFFINKYFILKIWEPLLFYIVLYSLPYI